MFTIFGVAFTPHSLQKKKRTNKKKTKRKFFRRLPVSKQLHFVYGNFRKWAAHARSLMANTRGPEIHEPRTPAMADEISCHVRFMHNSIHAPSSQSAFRFERRIIGTKDIEIKKWARANIFHHEEGRHGGQSEAFSQTVTSSFPQLYAPARSSSTSFR